MVTIQELEEKIKVLQRAKDAERREIIRLFRCNINNIINSTPTGQLRNDICDLNIMFESLIN